MSALSNYSPTLYSKTVIDKVLEIQKKYPFLIPEDDEIHAVFEASPGDLAKALYNEYNSIFPDTLEVLEKAKKSDQVSPYDPNLKQIVNRCLGYCRKGTCNARCQNAIRIYSQMSNGQNTQMQQGAGQQAHRMTNRASRTLNSYKWNKHIQGQLAKLDADLRDEMRANPQSKALVANYQIREAALTNLTYATERYKEQVLNYSAINPFSYTRAERSSRQELFGRGAATSDLANAFLKVGHINDVLSDVNLILKDYTKNHGVLSDRGMQNLEKYMKSINGHIPLYEAKVDKLLNDDSFIAGYMKELQVQADRYNMEMFSSAFKDADQASFMDLQQALSEIEPGNVSAARQAILELGNKRHGNDYADIYAESVDAYLEKNGGAIVKKYGNKATPQERQALVADVQLKSPFLQNKIKELQVKNAELKANGSKHQFDINNFQTLPDFMQKEIVKGVTLDLLEREGDHGIITASKYFGGMLDEATVKDAQTEHTSRRADRVTKLLSDYQGNSDIAPSMSAYKSDPEMFKSLSFDDQKAARQKMENEYDDYAKRNGVDTDSIPYKLAKQKALYEFTPMTQDVRDATIERDKNFAKPITRSDGMRMYQSDVFKEPLDFVMSHRKEAMKLMYDEQTGQLTKFGEFVEGAKNGVKAGYAHPLLNETKEIPTANGIQKVPLSEPEIQSKLKEVIDSVPAQYRNDVFNPRLQRYANTAINSTSVEQDFDKLAVDPAFSKMAQDNGIKSKTDYEKLSELSNKYAYKNNYSIINPSDAITYAKQIETDFINNSMTEDQVDEMFTDIASARGNDYANRLLQEKYNFGRNLDVDEVAAGPMKVSSSDPRVRANGYSSFLGKQNGKLSGGAPDKARNYASWRMNKLAEGGLKADNYIMQGHGFFDYQRLVEDIVTSHARDSGGEPTIQDFFLHGQPDKIQEVKEYLDEMGRQAEGNILLKDKVKAIYQGGKFSYDQGAQKGFFKPKPETWQQSMTKEQPLYEVLYEPKDDISDDQSFTDFYNSILDREKLVSSRPNTVEGQNELASINMFKNAVAGKENLTFDQAKPYIVRDLIAALENDPQNSLDANMRPGDRNSYGQLSSKNHVIDSVLGMIRLMDSEAYSKLVNDVREMPVSITTDISNGVFANPNKDQRYRSYDERSKAINNLARVSANDSLINRYTGYMPGKSNNLAFKENVKKIVEGNREGRDYAKHFSANVINPDNFSEFMNTTSSIVSQAGLQLQPGESFSLTDENLQKIPDMKTRYMLQEMRDTINEEGTEFDKTLMANMSISADGTFRLNNAPNVAVTGDKLPIVIDSFKSDEQANKSLESIYKEAENIQYDQNDAMTIINGENEDDSFTTPFVGMQDISYDADGMDKYTPMDRLNANNEAIGAMDSIKSLSPIKRAFTSVGLNSASKLYSDMVRAEASGVQMRQYVESKASEIMNNMARKYGRSSLSIPDLQEIGRTFMQYGDVKQALEVAGAITQMNELTATYKDYFSTISPTLYNANSFSQSKWDINGRDEPTFNQQ